MRAAFVLAVLLLAGETQALAQPPAIVLPEPLMVGRLAGHPPQADPESFQEIAQSGAMARRLQMAPQTSHPISLGPFSMDIANADIVGRDGKRAHYAHIELEGVQVLGGNVSGNFDGRAATLHLNWHLGQ